MRLAIARPAASLEGVITVWLALTRRHWNPGSLSVAH